MKRLLQWLKRFFLPPQEASIWLKIAPYLVLGFLTLVILGGGAYTWEYTNSPEFCGQTCHTMPPEYTSYLASPHARVECVDCHIGEGFITTRITRKAGDAKHVIATVFQTYEYPIKVKSMRPARETCELCHFPEKFSDDSLREYVNFRSDQQNSSYSVYLLLKTGGGSERQGLGQGIHWHIENPVYFLPLDQEEQEIPYILVENADSTTTEYFDLNAELDPEQIDPADLLEMDCITCHNRITHLVEYPEEIVDTLLSRELISSSIPEIRRVALDIFLEDYSSTQTAEAAFDLLDYFYEQQYPDYYQDNQAEISQAIGELKTAYTNSVYPAQKSDWSSHPDNIGHKNTPGCFRCHDGEHFNDKGEAIRLECNLCHAIPVIAEQGEYLAEIEISRGPEPANHLSTSWISLHHLVYDQSCGSCHSMADPGGASNTSFCSNGACHGFSYEFSGFNAPALREEILASLPTPQPSPTPVSLPEDPQDLTYSNVIQGIFESRCGACHGDTAQAGLNLLSYDTALSGTENGEVIVPGDPESSLVLIKTGDPGAHFSQFTTQEVELIWEWILLGAKEN